MSSSRHRAVRRVCVSLFALAAAAAAGAAHAQDAPAQDSRDAKIDQLEAEVQALAAEVKDLKAEQIQTLSVAQAAVTSQKPSVAVSLANGKPTIASSDGRFTLNLHGIMQLDSAFYDQPPAGPIAHDLRRDGPALGASTSNVDLAHARELKNGDDFRRARIGFDGTAFGDWDYKFIYDFGGTGTEDAGQVYETWVQYSGLKPFHFRVGAFSPSIGMEDQASTNSMPFIERSADSDIARGLAAGDTRTAFEIFGNGDHWLASGAVTGRTIGVISTGTASATAQSYGDQLGLVGRLAATPLYGSDWRIHIGVNGSYVVTPPNTGGPATTGVNAITDYVIAFSNTPELRVDGTKFINTGNIDARHADTVGLEFAAQKANFLIQSEYTEFGVKRDDGQASPNFHGYYVEGLWFLTGEHRLYNSQTGAFDGPIVAHPFSLSDHGLGAWELGVRYSDMDLNYDAGAAGTYQTGASIRGGEEQNLTAGLNWYPNQIVRFMFDYQHVRILRLSPATNASGASTIWFTPEGAQIGQSYNAFAIRSQVAF